jgi:hyaluronan synthase
MARVSVVSPLTLGQRLGAASAAQVILFLLVVLVIGALVLLASGQIASHWMMRTSSWRPVLLGSGVSGFFGLAWLIRVGLWWRYRPLVPTPEECEKLPTLTVVIPAYNEGEMVRRSIESVIASEYPAHRLQVIVVNDGSKDDTGQHIDAVARLHPDRVRAIHLPRNQGKRHALFEGFRLAQGQVIATVDSDSVVPRGSLTNLVVPFMRDARVGGVAGKVLVHNRQQNILTRMLGVRYIIGFDFVRAYQSQLKTVWCCPGALQAYRRSVIQPHLERWRDQEFLGVSCNNGDDHAMSNLVLSLGAHTVYQSTATVETLVPTTYVGLCKMYIRWGRSAAREGFLALRFSLQRALGLGPLRGPVMLMDALLQPLGIALRMVGLVGGTWIMLSRPHIALHGLATGTVFSLAYCAIFLRSERSFATLWGVVYAWYSIFALAWIQPFATLTVRRNGWLTRG